MMPRTTEGHVVVCTFLLLGYPLASVIILSVPILAKVPRPIKISSLTLPFAVGGFRRSRILCYDPE